MGVFRIIARKAGLALHERALSRRMDSIAEPEGLRKVLAKEGDGALIEALDRLLEEGRAERISSIMLGLRDEDASRVMERWCRGSGYDGGVQTACLDACRKRAEKCLRDAGISRPGRSASLGPYREAPGSRDEEDRLIWFLEEVGRERRDASLGRKASLIRLFRDFKMISEASEALGSASKNDRSDEKRDPGSDDDPLVRFISSRKEEGMDEETIAMAIERSGAIGSLIKALGQSDGNRTLESRILNVDHSGSNKMDVPGVGSFQNSVTTTETEYEKETVSNWDVREKAQSRLIRAGRHSIGPLEEAVASSQNQRYAPPDRIMTGRALRVLEAIARDDPAERTREEAARALDAIKKDLRCDPDMDLEPAPARRFKEVSKYTHKEWKKIY